MRPWPPTPPATTGCSTATRGDAAALAEIAAAHALINTSAFPDLLAALRLAWHRGQLARRNAHIPFKLPAVWVTLGQPVRAEALARSIPYESQRALALAGVAMAAAGAGDYDRARELAADAEQIARSTADPRRRAQVLAAAAAGAGDYDRAERIARSTAISLYDKPEILAAVAMAAARIGDYDRARELADHAERIARSITPLDLQSLPLAEVAMAAAGAGDYDRARELAANAEQIARSITNPTWRARNLAPAAAAAGAGDYDLAERIARSATDPGGQARALAEVAMAAAGPATTTAPGNWPPTPSRSPGPSPTRTNRRGTWPRRSLWSVTTTALSGSPGPPPTRTSRRGPSPRWPWRRPGPATTTAPGNWPPTPSRSPGP